MRRGLLTGIIIGGIVGAYYGMNMSGKDERRVRRMADDWVDRGSDMMDMMKDKANRLLDNVR